jgi:glyoxylase-like metal-dependent hydrolase (beta-lactamase superfamily II)
LNSFQNNQQHFKLQKSSPSTTGCFFDAPGHVNQITTFVILKYTIMINIKIFVFNSFGVNSFVLHDDTGECVIIDPGCNNPMEQEKLHSYISENNLKPTALINTHFHIDHILGNHFVCETYNLVPTGHKAGAHFWESANDYSSMFGLEVDQIRKPEKFVEHGDVIRFGNTQLEVRYTPGHADGSICLVNHEQKFVISGDVLFQESIGRTDLPTGDFDVLMDSLDSQLFTLENDFTVYPGHGPKTSIGHEKIANPFIR